MLNSPMQIMTMMQGAHNPMMMIQQIFGRSPQYNQIMQIVQSKNPQELEQYVRNLFKNQNINITQFASQFGLNIQ